MGIGTWKSGQLRLGGKAITHRTKLVSSCRIEWMGKRSSKTSSSAVTVIADRTACSYSSWSHRLALRIKMLVRSGAVIRAKPGTEMRVELSTTAIFGDLSGYFFAIFKDKVSNTTPCRPVTDCKMNDLEWPWVAIWRQNPFSASTLLQNRCVFWSALHKFEWR